MNLSKILQAAVITLALAVAALANQTQSHTHHDGAAQKTTVKSNAKATAKKPVVYVCPMHPDVKSHKVGSCPKCGMTLQAASAEAGAPAANKTEAVKTPTSGTEEAGRLSIPDVELLDQDGRKIHFYRDLVKGKVVAINFIFTTCTTICPPLGATFARVQKELGEKVGRDVHFISISVDPATDTPERLKAWGAKFHAGPGWTFVTGDKPLVDELLRSLAASVARREDHSPVVIIGNEAAGKWTRTYGLAKPSVLVKTIEDAMSAPVAQTSSKESER